jgi:hypothetical protein
MWPSLQIEAARRALGAPEPLSIPGYSCYETVEETFAAGDGLIAAKPTLARWADAVPRVRSRQNA